MSTPEEKKNKTEEVKMSLKFKFEDREYEINFPSNAQYIKIQNLIPHLADRVSDMKYNGPEGQLGELLVDCSAHLSVLAPKFMDDLKVPLLDDDCPFAVGLAVTTLYSAEIRPWYNKVMNFLFDANKKEEKKK